MKSAIDTVVFDVGWVLVHLDFAPLLECLHGSGQRYTIAEVVAAIDLEAHECGRLSGVRLIDNLHGLAPHANRERLKHAWLEMFLPIDPMWRLARDLAPRYRVHLLSNVGELHWLHLNNRFDLRALAHDALPSFQAGVMKPNDEIYTQAERRFQLDPARTVFIDDLEPNVRTA
jgi:glucose-1-phosphatase